MLRKLLIQVVLCQGVMAILLFIPAVPWQHINLLRAYDFSDEKLRDSVGIRPPKEVKNLGAAEPRYVLQSPGLVENCVRLYVPLLEFNHPTASQANERSPHRPDLPKTDPAADHESTQQRRLQP